MIVILANGQIGCICSQCNLIIIETAAIGYGVVDTNLICIILLTEYLIIANLLHVMLLLCILVLIVLHMFGIT